MKTLDCGHPAGCLREHDGKTWCQWCADLEIMQRQIEELLAKTNGKK